VILAGRSLPTTPTRLAALAKCSSMWPHESAGLALVTSQRWTLNGTVMGRARDDQGVRTSISCCVVIARALAVGDSWSALVLPADLRAPAS
jgi:hypothetical protein